MNTKIKYEKAKSENDLMQILTLQEENLPSNLTIEESRKEGFVTLKHSLQLLKRMNTPYPHIVARTKNEIIGYALVMLTKFSEEFPILAPMFEELKKTRYRGELVSGSRYFILGQICVKKEYRGMGAPKGLYQKMKDEMKADFDYIITEISTKNIRSLKAHYKIGFENIRTYKSGDGLEWIIVLLNLNS